MKIRFRFRSLIMGQGLVKKSRLFVILVCIKLVRGSKLLTTKKTKTLKE
jgi:hypothetical protein